MSVESMLLTSGAVGDDTNIPPQDAKTLFRMHTLRGMPDVKDKGPNNIPVTPSGGAYTFGVDAQGHFLNLGGFQWFSFNSAILAAQSQFDVTLILGNPSTPSGYTYGPAIIDFRPQSTNGQYVGLGLDNTLPPKTQVIYGGATSPLANLPGASGIVTITVQVRSDRINVLADGVQYQTYPKTGLAQQNFTFGKHAFWPTVGGIAPLTGRLYYLDVKSI